MELKSVLKKVQRKLHLMLQLRSILKLEKKKNGPNVVEIEEKINKKKLNFIIVFKNIKKFI